MRTITFRRLAIERSDWYVSLNLSFNAADCSTSLLIAGYDQNKFGRKVAERYCCFSGSQRSLCRGLIKNVLKCSHSTDKSRKSFSYLEY